MPKMELGPESEVGELFDRLQCNGCLPGLLTTRYCASGSLPPSDAINERTAGVISNTGAFTVNG